MATRKPSRRTLLLEHVKAQSLPIIDEPAAASLAGQFALSLAYLRKVLREAKIPMAPLVEGIRQDSFPELERTLLGMLEEYLPADRARRQQCRNCVITAKDHAKLAMLKDDADSRVDREEMILWMRTWLDNPGVFAQWLALRKRIRPT